MKRTEITTTKRIKMSWWDVATMRENEGYYLYDGLPRESYLTEKADRKDKDREQWVMLTVTVYAQSGAYRFGQYEEKPEIWSIAGEHGRTLFTKLDTLKQAKRLGEEYNSKLFHPSNTTHDKSQRVIDGMVRIKFHRQPCFLGDGDFQPEDAYWVFTIDKKFTCVSDEVRNGVKPVRIV